MLAVALLASALAVDETPANDVLVGVCYFAGWWEPLPNKWHNGQGEDWRPKYPERLPLLGEYNTQETVDKEIVAAAEHGVDFFSILFYHDFKGEEREPNTRFLNRGLTGFMASPEAHRMKFMIEYCNHPPYELRSDAEWADCIDIWVKAMAHPSYLKIDGRPVLKIHGAHYFYKQNDSSVEKCLARLAQLREAAKAAGVGDPLIGGGVGGPEAVGAEHWASKLFDFTATYGEVPNAELRDEPYPFGDLLKPSVDARKTHANDVIPYVPFIMVGWAPRPWGDPRPDFAFPTREEWTSALRQLKSDLLAQPNLGLPGAKAFTIYAWNEFGEGGFVAPTKGDGYMKLEAVREVFGK